MMNKEVSRAVKRNKGFSNIGLKRKHRFKQEVSET